MLPTATYDVLDTYTAMAALGIASSVRYRWERLALAHFLEAGPEAMLKAPLRVPGMPHPLARWQIQRLEEWAVLRRRTPPGSSRRGRSTRHPEAPCGGYHLTPLGVAVARASVGEDRVGARQPSGRRGNIRGRGV